MKIYMTEIDQKINSVIMTLKNEYTRDDLTWVEYKEMSDNLRLLENSSRALNGMDIMN